MKITKILKNPVIFQFILDYYISWMSSAENNTVDLVKKARQGCSDSMEQLATLVEGRLRAYLYRITLDHSVTEDLLQETLLQMVKSLKSLQKAESFWPWLYRVAMGKAQHHFRSEKKHRKVVSLSSTDLSSVSTAAKSDIDGLSAAQRNELAHAVFKSLGDLKLQYRSVMVLRCFEKRSYAEIAEIMNCRKTLAQVWFFRAKRNLRKELSRSGFGKALMLPALGLFGKLTAPAEAALVTTVAGESTSIGLTATIIGIITTKLGLLGAAALLLLGVGSMVAVNNSNDNDGWSSGVLRRSEIKSLRFFKLAPQTFNKLSPNLAFGRSMSKGAYEQLYYFPEGIDKSVFMMIQRWTPERKIRQCGWLQNKDGNYYYHAGEKIIYQRNFRLPLRDFRTRRLPSDTPAMVEFMDSLEGKISGVQNKRDPKTGLLISALDSRFSNAMNFQSNVSYNSLDLDDFDSFIYPWPKEASVVDQRDAMHKRGWTYFRVYGEIDNQRVTGRGKIPFVYGQYCVNKPWLELDIENGLKIVDTPDGACVFSVNQEPTAAYRAGSFFIGLSQPWKGMHAIDTVRRAAAKQRIAYTTKMIGGGEKVIVKLSPNGSRWQIVYIIDIHKDLVEQIEFTVTTVSGQSRAGVLEFEYLDDIAGVESEFIQPAPPKFRKKGQRDSRGIMWLFELADGTLVL